VAIINERAAETYWPGQDPVGQRITFDDGKGNPPVWLTVIGIARNAKQYDWASPAAPEVYRAALQDADFMDNPQSHTAYLTLVVRTAGNAADLAPTVKRVVWSIDRNLPISEVVTMDHAVEMANARPRFEMFLLGMFGALALLLAAVGVYGVMNYSISRRTHEIGIRIALGARRTEILRMVVAQGMLQALAGSAVGIAGALLLSRLMTKMLYGVRPDDPLTFGSVALTLILTALAATLIPAHRATRIQPMTALRNE
jgi:putative ABC transport system permease protein